jgi:hypothetical protein
MNSVIENTIERNGTGIERNGTGIERNGTGIERNGTGIERNGTGIERNGTGIRRGFASAFALMLVAAFGTATADVSGDSDPMRVAIDGDRVTFFKGTQDCYIAGTGTLIDGYAVFDLTSSVGLRALVPGARASADSCSAEYIRVVGNGTGDKVVGNGTGDKVVGNGTGSKVVGNGTGSKVVGNGTGDKVVGNGTGDKVVGNGTGSPAPFWGEVEIALDEKASSASVLLYKADAEGKTAESSAFSVSVVDVADLAIAGSSEAGDTVREEAPNIVR